MFAAQEKEDNIDWKLHRLPSGICKMEALQPSVFGKTARNLSSDSSVSAHASHAQ